MLVNGASGDVYVSQQTGSALGQVLTCRLMVPIDYQEETSVNF